MYDGVICEGSPFRKIIGMAV